MSNKNNYFNKPVINNINISNFIDEAFSKASSPYEINKMLLNNQISSINIINKNHETLLNYYLKYNITDNNNVTDQVIKNVKWYIDNKININYPNLYGERPINHLVKLNNYELINLLINNGAILNKSTQSGYYLIHYLYNNSKNCPTINVNKLFEIDDNNIFLNNPENMDNDLNIKKSKIDLKYIHKLFNLETDNFDNKSINIIKPFNIHNINNKNYLIAIKWNTNMINLYDEPIVLNCNQFDYNIYKLLIENDPTLLNYMNNDMDTFVELLFKNIDFMILDIIKDNNKEFLTTIPDSSIEKIKKINISNIYKYTLNKNYDDLKNKLSRYYYNNYLKNLNDNNNKTFPDSNKLFVYFVDKIVELPELKDFYTELKNVLDENSKIRNNDDQIIKNFIKLADVNIKIIDNVILKFIKNNNNNILDDDIANISNFNKNIYEIINKVISDNIIDDIKKIIKDIIMLYNDYIDNNLIKLYSLTYEEIIADKPKIIKDKIEPYYEKFYKLNLKWDDNYNYNLIKVNFMCINELLNNTNIKDKNIIKDNFKTENFLINYFLYNEFDFPIINKEDYIMTKEILMLIFKLFSIVSIKEFTYANADDSLKEIDKPLIEENLEKDYIYYKDYDYLHKNEPLIEDKNESVINFNNIKETKLLKNLLNYIIYYINYISKTTLIDYIKFDETEDDSDNDFNKYKLINFIYLIFEYNYIFNNYFNLLISLIEVSRPLINNLTDDVSNEYKFYNDYYKFIKQYNLFELLILYFKNDKKNFNNKEYLNDINVIIAENKLLYNINKTPNLNDLNTIEPLTSINLIKYNIKDKDKVPLINNYFNHTLFKIDPELKEESYTEGYFFIKKDTINKIMYEKLSLDEKYNNKYEFYNIIGDKSKQPNDDNTLTEINKKKNLYFPYSLINTKIYDLNMDSCFITFTIKYNQLINDYNTQLYIFISDGESTFYKQKDNIIFKFNTQRNDGEIYLQVSAQSKKNKINIKVDKDLKIKIFKSRTFNKLLLKVLIDNKFIGDKYIYRNHNKDKLKINFCSFDIISNLVVQNYHIVNDYQDKNPLVDNIFITNSSNLFNNEYIKERTTKTPQPTQKSLCEKLTHEFNEITDIENNTSINNKLTKLYKLENIFNKNKKKEIFDKITSFKNIYLKKIYQIYIFNKYLNKKENKIYKTESEFFYYNIYLNKDLIKNLIEDKIFNNLPDIEKKKYNNTFKTFYKDIFNLKNDDINKIQMLTIIYFCLYYHLDQASLKKNELNLLEDDDEIIKIINNTDYKTSSLFKNGKIDYSQIINYIYNSEVDIINKVKEKFTLIFNILNNFNFNNKEIPRVVNNKLKNKIFSTDFKIFEKNNLEKIIRSCSYFKKKKDLIIKLNIDEIGNDYNFNIIKNKIRNDIIDYIVTNDYFTHFSNLYEIEEDLNYNIQKILNTSVENLETLIKNYQLLINYIMNYYKNMSELAKTIKLAN